MTGYREDSKDVAAYLEQTKVNRRVTSQPQPFLELNHFLIIS